MSFEDEGNMGWALGKWAGLDKQIEWASRLGQPKFIDALIWAAKVSKPVLYAKARRFLQRNFLQTGAIYLFSLIGNSKNTQMLRLFRSKMFSAFFCVWWG